MARKKKLDPLAEIEAAKAAAVKKPNIDPNAMPRTEYNRRYQAAVRRALAALRFQHEDEFQELFTLAKDAEGI